MADGDMAYSHVPGAGGALLCESGGGRLLFRRKRVYWSLRFDWSFESGYDGSPPGYEEDSWIPRGMVRDGAGRYHLDWAVRTSHGGYVSTPSDSEPPFDFSDASVDELFCIRANGNVQRDVPANRSGCTVFAMYRGVQGVADGLRVTVDDEFGGRAGTNDLQTAWSAATVSGTLAGPLYGAWDFAASITLSALRHHPLCPH